MAQIEAPARITLMDLPPELHLLISSHLPYPDALSLKHCNRYFYNTVYTGVALKIEWLIARKKLHLECPQDGPCMLNSDRDFCRGSVRLLMERRRQHGECEAMVGGRGCLVLGTKTCEWKRARSPWVKLCRWAHKNLNLGMLVCVLVGLVGFVWMRVVLEMGIGKRHFAGYEFLRS